MAEKIEAEITLGYREFAAGVDAVVRESQKLGKGVEQGLGSIEQKARDAFSAFGKEARIAISEYQQFAQRVQDASSKISLQELQGQLQGIAQAGARAFGDVLQSGANFEEGLLRINTIAGLSQDELQGLGERLKNVGKEIGVSATPTQTLASYYDVLSSGFTKTADATKVLSASLKLASGGQAEASETTRALTGVLNAYGDSSEKAQLRADQFFQTVNLGVTTIPELSKSLGLVTSTAASAGVSFEELSAAIATATLRGQTTSAAIEGIRGVIGSLISPTSGAQKEFARLGITVNATTLQQKGLLATLQEIRDASGGQVDSINKIIEGQVGLATALALSKDGGQAFKSNLEQIAGAAGASDKALAQVNQGVNESSKAFQASLERLKISASEAAIPIEKTLFGALKSVVDLAASAPKPLQAAALAMVGLGTAASFAAAGAVSLSIIGPTLIGQYTALGARIIPLAASAVRLLTVQITAQQAAMALQAGAAGAAARATALFTAAQTGMSTAAAGAMAAISGVGLAMIAIPAAIGVAIAAYTQLQEEVNAANEAMLKSEDLRENGRQVKGNVTLSNTDLLASSAQDLAKRGVTTDDITQRIIDQEKAAELAREQQNAEQERKARERIKRLRALRTELAGELEKIQAESKKPPVVEQQKDAKGEAKLKREEEKKRKESVADAVQEIENSRRTSELKIKMLRDIISEYQLLGSERRAIEDKIFALEKANDTERKKAAEEERKNSVADSVQEIENSKKTNQEKIQGLKNVLLQYKANATERRSIEDKIFKLEQADEAAKRKAAAAEVKKAKAEKAADDKKARTEKKEEKDTLTGGRDALANESDLAKKRVSILQELASVGAATQFELQKAIQESLKLRLAEIDAEEALAKAQATTAEESAAASKKAKVARVEAENEAKRAIDSTTKAMIEQKRQSQQGSKNTRLDLSGNVYSLSDFFAQQGSFFDLSKPSTKRGDPKEIARQRDVLRAMDAGPAKKELSGGGDSSVMISEAIKQTLKGLPISVAVQLYDSNGSPIPSTVKKASVAGRNSEIQQQLRGMA